MKQTSSLLKNPLFREISIQAKQKLSQFTAIESTIVANIPQQFSKCFKILNYENNVLILEVNSVWLTWIKGQEQSLLKILNSKYGVEKIKWRNNPNPHIEEVKPRNEVKISPKSAKIVADVAKSIKNKKLKDALLKLATRSK